MPRLKRSEALKTLGAVPPPPPRPAIIPTQEAYHLKCPTCGLLARLDLVQDGPHIPLYSRLQRYGGYSTTVWDPPIPATNEEYNLILARLETALERLRPRPPYVPPVVPPPLPPPPPPPPVVVPSFTLAERPARRSAQALIRHLQFLERIGVEKPKVGIIHLTKPFIGDKIL